jgi:hypothetical protein
VAADVEEEEEGAVAVEAESLATTATSPDTCLGNAPRAAVVVAEGDVVADEVRIHFIYCDMGETIKRLDRK